jgi:sugar lactone lactonase YvrE
MGVATTSGGAVVFAEYGTGAVHLSDGGEIRKIASGLSKPMGVAVQGDTIFVAEAGSGRISMIRNGSSAEALVTGLGRPEGLCVSNGMLYAVDTTAKTLFAIDPASGDVTAIVSGLPVGAPAGITPKFLGPIGDMSGPMVNFAGIAAGSDGTLYLSGDGEGSVIAVRQA